jgi:ABC-type nitrate/sulfonate/bicarbonate transport system ATPase subunit
MKPVSRQPQPKSAAIGSASDSNAIALDRFSLTFKQGLKAIDQVTLNIKKGEFVTLIGPSGCGKSTMLSAIAGLVTPRMASTDGSMTVAADRIGYIFQRDTLLPWRTVLENVELGLEVRRVPRNERRAVARQYLKAFGIQDFGDSYVHLLSGGMKQRAALARTLAYDPDVILMDEPFAAVDAQMRIILQSELTKLWEEKEKTIIFVTHDLPEAIIIAQRTIVFSNRPATVRADVQIDLARPRDPFGLRTNKRYLEIYSELWGLLSSEVLEQVRQGQVS